MKDMTQQNIINAFGGESMAHMRYRHFINIAEREGFTNVARLFRAIAHVEFIHAGDHYRELIHLEKGIVANSMGAYAIGDTLKNIGLGIVGESFEINEMYPIYIQTAKFQEEDGAVRTFEWALNTEKQHKKLYEKAEKAVKVGKDVNVDAIQVCEVFGYTLEGEAPEECPICGAKKEKFASFE